jgi:hypothetical protein
MMVSQARQVVGLALRMTTTGSMTMRMAQEIMIRMIDQDHKFGTRG